MKGLFRYPEKAKFGQIIPKAKIYENAKLKPIQKAQFVDLIQQIRWAHKLAPETTNLSATDDVREIQILQISQQRNRQTTSYALSTGLFLQSDFRIDLRGSNSSRHAQTE